MRDDSDLPAEELVESAAWKKAMIPALLARIQAVQTRMATTTYETTAQIAADQREYRLLKYLLDDPLRFLSAG